MKIQVWGARGSIPTPSTTHFVTSRYGGNTTCVSIRTPGQLLILDGGSGLRNLGLALAAEMPVRGTFFFSHLHWDHIQGVPFFIPCFAAGNRFDLYGGLHDGGSSAPVSHLEEALRSQQRSLNFPVQLPDLPAELHFFEFKEGVPIELRGTAGPLVVTPRALNHPGRCYGYRVEERREDGAHAFVFATDTEHLAEPNPVLQDLARGADVLFYDAQYTEDEYEGRSGMPHRGWGHSTWKHGLREAVAAGVKRLLLTHHDPLHDDWEIARLENQARREGNKAGVQVDAAYEGLEITL